GSAARPRPTAPRRRRAPPAGRTPPQPAARASASCRETTRAPMARQAGDRPELEHAPPRPLHWMRRPRRRPSRAPPHHRRRPGCTVPRRPPQSRRTGRGSAPARPARGASVAESCGGAYHRIRGSSAPGSRGPGGCTGHGRPGHCACVALVPGRPRRTLRREPNVTPLEAARHGEMPRRYLNAIRAMPVRRHPASRRFACALGPTCLAVLLLPAALLTAPFAQAQDLGHKLLGGVGIDAGVQAEPGFYLIDRIVRYDASRLRDRNGNLVPIRGLNIDVVANAFGASLTLKPEDAPYLGFAFGLPLADISVNANDPRIAVDRSGFADIFVQPLKLGWRLPRGDVVTSYAFYAPTGRFDPRGRAGVGRGFWSHQFSLGGAIFAGRERQIRASALLSYDINLRKRDIDIRRGNTLQIQGGAGVRFVRIVDIGIAGF